MSRVTQLGHVEYNPMRLEARSAIAPTARLHLISIGSYWQKPDIHILASLTFAEALVKNFAWLINNCAK